MEYRKRCKVCGQIWCYTDADLKQDISNGVTSILHGIGGIAAGVGGNVFQQQYAADRMENDERKRVNRNQCPNCKSLDCEMLTDEMFAEIEMKKSFENAKVSINANASIETLLKRVELLLEDKEWANANAYCDNILDVEPENATAYLYKLMAELKACTKEELKNCKAPFDDKSNYLKAVRFGSDSLKELLQDYNTQIKDRIEDDRKAKIYDSSVREMNSNNSEEYFKVLAERFGSIKDYKDSVQLQQICFEKAEKVKEAAEAAKKVKSKKSKILLIVILGIIVAVVAISIVTANESKNKEAYNTAISLADSMDCDDILEAIAIFETLGGYDDSDERLEKAKEDVYNTAKEYLGFGRNEDALELFRQLNDYKDCPQIAEELEKEINIFNEIYNSSPIDDKLIKRAKEVVENSKYVSVEWFKNKVNCFYEYDNKEWKYVSGDPTAISRATKTVGECKTITTVFSKTKGWESECVTISDGSKNLTSVGISTSSTYSYTEETGSLTMKEPAYITADVTLVFSSSNTLEIIVETPNDNIYKCTYEKV